MIDRFYFREWWIILVKIFIADASTLVNKKLYSKLYQSLDLNRQAKADALILESDKRLSVGAAALLKYVLEQLGVKKQIIEIEKNGKPYLKDNDNIHFNISHSGSRVMCAISDKEVGCDVQKSSNLKPDFMEYVMTEAELKEIYSYENVDERKDMFFRIWSLKESYVKATGMGLKRNPKSISILDIDSDPKVYPSVDDKKYYFKEYSFDDGYYYSCCSLSEIFNEYLTVVNFNDLIK